MLVFSFMRPNENRALLAILSRLAFEVCLCVETALIIHFENKFEKLFACFFSLATKCNSHNKKAFENAFAFLEKGEND